MLLFVRVACVFVFDVEDEPILETFFRSTGCGASVVSCDR